MSYFARIMQKSDLEEILDFERAKLRELPGDPMEQEMASWNSRWRQESLEHHLPLGWSFLLRDPNEKSKWSSEGQLVAYFLAQPLLFFDNQTQSLWVEHVSYNQLQARDQICELAYKLGREKHFQRVYFPRSQGVLNATQTFRPEPWNAETVFVKTTKV